MIKFIVSDMDGTLFEGHGETVFDLTERNQAALKRVQEAGIEFCVASGRMIGYGIRLLERYGFRHIRAAGFNGAVCYDDGEFVDTKPVDYGLLQKIVPMIQEKFPQVQVIQIQGLGSERIFSRADRSGAKARYGREIEKIGIGKLPDITVEEFLQDAQGILPGKLSIIMPTRAECLQVIEAVQSLVADKCFITMSDETLIEIGNRETGKNVFVNYLRRAYGLKKEEISVIGDALNDGAMFDEAGLCFAMESGDGAVKRRADVVVPDVCSCIDDCIARNRAESGEIKNV